MKNNFLGKKEIEELLPHRKPMLLIDKLIDIVPLKSATAIVNVRKNSFYVQGHFPNQPIVPGVILIEALAQTAGIVVSYSFAEQSEKTVLFMSVSNGKFRKPVGPNDEIIFEVKLTNRVNSVYRFYGEAKKKSEKVCEAVFSAMIVEKK